MISFHFMVAFLVFVAFGASAFCANVIVKDSNPPLKRTIPNIQYSSAAGRGSVASNSIHVVNSGETLFGIAKQYNIPYQIILEVNHLNVTDGIKVGQKLIIPQEKKTWKEAKSDVKSPNVKVNNTQKMHIVIQGDTLFGIARMYSVNALDLATENGVDLSYMVKVGQKLQIPGLQQDQDRSQAIRSTSVQSSVQSLATSATKSSSTCNLNFGWPINSRKIIYQFGSLLPNGTKTDGVIFSAERGNNIVASYSGTIAYAGTDIPEYGKLMIVKHKDNWLTIYGYMDSFERSVGQSVKSGDVIGKTGQTGDATQPSLYFSIRQVKKPHNPVLCL